MYIKYYFNYHRKHQIKVQSDKITNHINLKYIIVLEVNLEINLDKIEQVNVEKLMIKR